MPSQRPLPTVWDDAQLQEDRWTSQERFVTRLLNRGTAEYEAIFGRAVNRMRSIFQKTNDLADVEQGIGLLTPQERNLFRYVSIPPLSQDDADTITLYLNEVQGLDSSSSLAKGVMSNYDPIRFEWLGRRCAPSDEEREAAIRWTCGLYALQRVTTQYRTQASRAQEEAVHQALTVCGYALNTERSFALDLLDSLPRGQFRKETKVATTDSRGQQSYAKADVPIRLRDGRLMLIECKVSNSDVNSIKRIEREACGKASGWRNCFGQGIILAVVFEGVASMATLKKAQEEYNEYLFWGHRLDDLSAFIRSC